MSSLHKRVNPNVAGNCTVITLLGTAYKLYAGILDKRLKVDIGEKKILGNTQAGFRKDRCTIDNVHILQQEIEKELKKRGDKIYAFFINLKAAFNTIYREILETMVQKGIRDGLEE